MSKKVPSFTVEELAEATAALDARRSVSYWPPRRLRGTIKPCTAHGSLHYHTEAVALLGGGVVAHIHDPAPYASGLAAMVVLDQMAIQMGVPNWSYHKHDEFEHSMEPELEADDDDSHDGDVPEEELRTARVRRDNVQADPERHSGQDVLRYLEGKEDG